MTVRSLMTLTLQGYSHMDSLKLAGSKRSQNKATYGDVKHSRRRKSA